MSLFYSSNERKERKYVKENKIRELNDEAQQQIVDDEISKELGLDEKATNLGKLATRVINKLGTEILPKPVGTDIKFTTEQFTPMELLTNSIKNGTLSDLFEKLKALPNKLLNKTQRIIRDDLSDTESKNMINELIADDVSKSKSADEIRKTVLESLGGIGNEEIVLDMIRKAKEASFDVSTSSKESKVENILKKKKRVREVKSVELAMKEIENAMKENEEIIELLQEKEAGKKKKYKIPTKSTERKALQDKKGSNLVKIKNLSDKFKL